jgi:hypothetical protein
MMRMVNVNKPQRSAAILRGMLTGLVIVYASAVYLEWHPPRLSAEATQYRQLVWLSMSGFSLNYLLQRLCLIVGNSAGALGVALMLVRNRRGLPLLLLCPPLLGVAALSGAAPAAYPDLEGTTTMLLWCGSSAIWGCVVVYALLRRDLLFLGPQPTKQSNGDSPEGIQRSI